jgi:hypothetical protein
MFKFFRKIRKNLINENKTSKYLKYAFGEIILVVLGILIALQINNWNEDRKDRILEKEYLTRLQEDIRFDISYINYYVLDRYKRKVESIEKGKAYYQDNYVVKDTMQFLNDIGYGGVFGYAVLNLTQNTYNELLSTGNLRKIENDALRTHIVNYYENTIAVTNASKSYVSGYIKFTNSFSAFNKKNPDYISEFDQKLLLKNIKTEEFYRLANLELTLAHRVSKFAEDIINDAEKLILNIDIQLDD